MPTLSPLPLDATKTRAIDPSMRKSLGVITIQLLVIDFLPLSPTIDAQEDKPNILMLIVDVMNDYGFYKTDP